MTQLMLCARDCTLSECKKLIKNGANPNIKRPYDDKTALLFALKAKKTNIARLLIPLMKPDALNEMITHDLDTALSIAISRGYKDIVLLLLEHGADVNKLATPNRRSALYLALEVISIDKHAKGFKTKDTV